MGQVNVIAVLKTKPYGAPTRTLFTKKGQIEITPEQTEIMFGGVICLLDKYDQKDGVIYLWSYLSSLSKEHFSELKALGWKINEAQAREYGLRT